MSLRSRKSLASAGRWLVIDVALVAFWYWGRHSTWAGIARWALGLLVMTAVAVAYTWWWYGDPGRVAAALRLREERAARRRLK